MNATKPQQVQPIGWEWNKLRQYFGATAAGEMEQVQDPQHLPAQEAEAAAPEEARSQHSLTPLTGEAYLARLTGEQR